MAEDLRISFRLEHAAFDSAVQRFITQYRGGVSNAIRRVGFELERRTTQRTTRVITGRMKNGFHVSFHRPSNWAPSEENPLERHPNPGNPSGMRTMFLQNRVHYAIEHEFGRRGLSPLLMLTKSVAELRGELERYLSEGIRPLWNREINGIGGTGLSPQARIDRDRFVEQRFGTSGGARPRRRGRR